MRPSKYVALFAGAAIAQESATIINFFQFDSTLTVLGSDASATTYQMSCPSDGAGISAVPSDLLNTDDPSETLFTSSTPDATPTPTPALRMRRQEGVSSDDFSFCEPYTILQGPETYEMHLTDPTPGAWTVDMACSWQGAMTTADLTCDITNRGSIPSLGAETETKSILSQSEIQDMAVYQVVTLVTASGASSEGSASATGTPASTGSGTGATSPSRSGSGTAATPSTGLALAGSIPNAMAMIGGAVGVLAAAMAL